MSQVRSIPISVEDCIALCRLAGKMKLTIARYDDGMEILADGMAHQSLQLAVEEIIKEAENGNHLKT